jgi:hypothetical protein
MLLENGSGERSNWVFLPVRTRFHNARAGGAQKVSEMDHFISSYIETYVFPVDSRFNMDLAGSGWRKGRIGGAQRSWQLASVPTSQRASWLAGRSSTAAAKAKPHEKHARARVREPELGGSELPASGSGHARLGPVSHWHGAQRTDPRAHRVSSSFFFIPERT